MTWPIVLRARLEGGLLQFNTGLLAKLLKGRRDSDLEVIIERKHATRSLVANAYYWGVVVALIAEHTGYTTDEVHELLKAKFLPRRIVMADVHGEVKEEIIIGQTTTRLNKIEFGEYVEKCRHFAADELGIVTPDPDPDWKSKRAS